MRIAVNGFGRVFTRIALERGLKVVGVNDVTDAATLAHLLAYDSTYGRLRARIEHTDDTLVVDGPKIAVTVLRDPARLARGELGADVVIESTGKFRAREQAAHLAAGARKVLISAPAKGTVDATIVMGVRSSSASGGLQRVVHHQLRGADGGFPGPVAETNIAAGTDTFLLCRAAEITEPIGIESTFPEVPGARS